MQEHFWWLSYGEDVFRSLTAQGIAVFLDCLHTFSESMPHTLRTLYTNQKNIHTMGKTPQFSCKLKLHIQNNVTSSQNAI